MNSCPRIPKENLYADLSYAGSKNKRRQLGGAQQITLIDYIPGIIHLNTAQFQAALLEGYTVEKELGKGGQGKVDLIKLDNPALAEMQLVMKTMKVCSTGSQESSLEIALNEYNVHKILFTAPNVNKGALMNHFIPAFAVGQSTIVDPSLGSIPLYHVFFPYFAGISLGDFLDSYKASGEKINAMQLRKIIDDIEINLRILHSFNIIHRDIKLDNVYLTITRYPDGTSEFTARLIDFGLAVPKGHISNPGTGTEAYLTPLHRLSIGRPIGWRASESNNLYAMSKIEEFLTPIVLPSAMDDTEMDVPDTVDERYAAAMRTIITTARPQIINNIVASAPPRIIPGLQNMSMSNRGGRRIKKTDRRRRHLKRTRRRR